MLTLCFQFTQFKYRKDPEQQAQVSDGKNVGSIKMLMCLFYLLGSL